MTLKERILFAVQTSPGLTDRELTNQLLGTTAQQQAVNQAARALAAESYLKRDYRTDGKIGNYPSTFSNISNRNVLPVNKVQGEKSTIVNLSEDDVKRTIKSWLEADGWQVQVKWGRDRGIDIDAKRNTTERWVIEAKGGGSRNAMRVNYFLAMLGETLQRMTDETARYSIALPDMEQFRRLWAQLPKLAKMRTQISIIFVKSNGEVREVN